jgi:hypothetical protein
MATHDDFTAVFEALKKILKRHAARLTITIDQPGNYSLNAAYSEKYKRDIFFGAVSLKKNYVSYYLMPVYMFPDLLKGLSPELKRRMQGKSCFNFKTADKALLAELAALTRKGFERLKQEQLV